MNILFEPRRDNSFYSLDLKLKLGLPEMYFVFGSNLAGRHGAGAAKEAQLKYGARYGVGEGFQGQSYGIPTKSAHLNTLPLKTIALHVDKFKVITKLSNRLFYVTPIGTGLAGYRHEDIAPMFRGCVNCWFPLEWRDYILTSDEIQLRIERGEVHEYD